MKLHRISRLAAGIACASLGTSAIPHALGAQILAGEAVESLSGEPLIGLRVRLLCHDTEAFGAGVLERRYPVPIGGRGAERPYYESEVDQPAMQVAPFVAPRYPVELQRAGVGGSVLADYVVDSTGRVEPGSFRALQTSHPALMAAVEQSVYELRFRPAAVAWSKVRQRVQQPFDFRVLR